MDRGSQHCAKVSNHQGSPVSNQNHPKKEREKKKTKKCKKINFLSEEALHIAEERCEAKSKRKKKKKKKGKLYPTEYNFRE